MRSGSTIVLIGLAVLLFAGGAALAERVTLSGTTYYVTVQEEDRELPAADEQWSLGLKRLQAAAVLVDEGKRRAEIHDPEPDIGPLRPPRAISEPWGPCPRPPADR